MLLNLQSVCFIVYVVKNYVNPKPHYYQNQNQGWIHDFPGGGQRSKEEHQPILWPNIPENCMKMKTICNQLYRLRFAHQFQAEMPEAKVS